MKPRSVLAPVFVALAAAALPAVADAQSFHLVEATIDEIQAQYRAGRLSPEQVVQMYLARIAAYDRSNRGQPLNNRVGQQPLNAFMHLNAQALRDAGRLDEDFDEGDDDGGGKPLFGIPVILKDNIATSDMPRRRDRSRSADRIRRRTRSSPASCARPAPSSSARAR